MSDLTPVQPKSVWKRPVTVDFRKLFSAVGKVVIDIKTGSGPGAVKDGFGIIEALGLGQSPEEVAGLLVARALARTVVELIEPYRRDFPEEIGEFEPEIQAFLTEREYVLDERFLDHPRELSIVGEFQHAFEHWLKFVNMRGHVAQTIAARVPARFVYALHRECIERPGDNTRLFSALEGRFTEAWRRERSWEEYRHWLESSLDDSVFGEDFGLRQIFLWPRAYFVTDKVAEGNKVQHVVELREHLDRWMAGAVEGHDAVRVLSGDPGAGKSSFTRMYAAYRTGMGDRVLLVPLHMLNVAHDLREALISLCEATPPFPKAPFEGEERLLLILDGLDELSKQGNSGARLAHEFAQHVQQLVNVRNLGGERLRVIISGRPISVEALETEFRVTGQLLHLLPYVLKFGSQWDVVWHDPEKLLTSDQRHAWWQRYGELTGLVYEGLPEALASESLFEISRQPLLGYLLAIVYRDSLARSQTIDQDVSLNEIYMRLLQSVYERDYDKSAGGHRATRGLTRAQFEELLEEMALVAWHVDSRIVQVSALKATCARSGLDNVLDSYIERAQSGVSQLFTAFYFRRSGTRTSNDEAFEFTHKSFAEYLVARRFVAELAAAGTNLAERSASAGRHARGKDATSVLLDWLHVFGPSPISRDLMRFLEDEVRLRSVGSDFAAKWQDALQALINETLRYGMPCERITPGLPFKEMLCWSANAELALLVMMQCCATVAERRSVIAWENKTTCRSWLSRLQASNTVTPLTLGWVVLTAQWLHGANLTAAQLANADLTDAILNNAVLVHSHLAKAVLNNADLRGANLTNATLTCATLVNSDLSGSALTDANLRGAVLTGAKLVNADLMSAVLTDADLTNVNLAHSDMTNASLMNAALTNASLTNAILDDALFTPEQIASARGRPRSS